MGIRGQVYTFHKNSIANCNPCGTLKRGTLFEYPCEPKEKALT